MEGRYKVECWGESEGWWEGDTTDFQGCFPRDGRTESRRAITRGPFGELDHRTLQRSTGEQAQPVWDSYSFCVKKLLMLVTAFPPEIACR